MYSFRELIEEHCTFQGLIAGTGEVMYLHEQVGGLAVTHTPWTGGHDQQLSILLRGRPPVGLEEGSFEESILLIAGAFNDVLAFSQHVLGQSLQRLIVFGGLGSDLAVEVGLNVCEPEALVG